MEIGIDSYILLNIIIRTYSTGNSTQWSVMTYLGMHFKKRAI